MNTGKVTKIKETDETYDYNENKFTVYEVELNGSEPFVWARWENSPLPSVNDVIEYEHNGVDKAGRNKIKKVRVQSVRLIEASGGASAEEAKQIFISRSVAIEHAVKFVDMTKSRVIDDNPMYCTDYSTRVVHVADLFFRYIFKGEIPEFVAPVKEVAAEKPEVEKKPSTRKSATKE